eukprot:7249389-Pyramimonas_sp.AAC.1
MPDPKLRRPHHPELRGHRRCCALSEADPRDIMAPTSQSGVRLANDGTGPDCPREFRSGFRSECRAVLWPGVKIYKTTHKSTRTSAAARLQGRCSEGCSVHTVETRGKTGFVNAGTVIPGPRRSADSPTRRGRARTSPRSRPKTWP